MKPFKSLKMPSTDFSREFYLTLILIVVAFGAFISLTHQSVPNASFLTSPQAVVAKAQALNQEQEYSESIDLLLRGAEKYPADGDLRALLKTTLSSYVGAQISRGYAKIALNKHDIDGYLGVASGFALANDSFRVMEVLTVGVMENPQSVPLWINIGLYEMKKNRDAEAYAVFSEVVKMDNKNAQAYNSMAFLESRSKDVRLLNLDSAKSNANKAVNLEPENPDYLDTLAEVHFRLGDKAKAKELISQAIGLAPEEPYYQAQLARFELNEGTRPSQMRSRIAN